MSEKIIVSNERSLGTSKLNFLQNGSVHNSLIPTNDSLNKKTTKEKDKDKSNTSIKKLSVKKQKIDNESLNSKTSSKRNKKAFRLDMESSSANRSLLILEERNYEERKRRPSKPKVKEKRYIVDNIDNIFTKLNQPKMKLHIQEILLYIIVFDICIYFWIFLFISRSKIERNYCFGRLSQFDSCSTNQICSDYKNNLNLILFNDTFILHNNTLEAHELFVEENKLINIYYKPFYVRYSHLLSSHKLFSKIQMLSNTNDKTNFVIVLTAKEKWNLFYRFFSLCEFDNYYIIFVIMISVGGIIGSLIFGFLSDIYGRRSTIRSTLFISTISTILLAIMSVFFDRYYTRLLNNFNKNIIIDKEDSTFQNIIGQLYAQDIVRNTFRKYFNCFALIVFFLSGALWPLLKSCMALLIENSTGELKVLIGFRRYNFAFGGVPAFFTSLIFVNLNSFTITFMILSFFNFLLFVFSIVFVEESLRYYYEYCDWPRLTEVILNTYKVNIKDFRTLNDEELKEFRKEENKKNFNKTVRKMKYSSKDDNNTSFVISNTYYNDLKEKNNALNRNIKRDTDFIIKYNDVQSNPLIIFICLYSNRTIMNSKFLILIVLILLYIVMDLLEKELLETPFFSIKDLYIDMYNNFIINSVFFLLGLFNIASNFFFYAFYRINCFKTIIVGSLVYVTMALFVYHMLTSDGGDTPIDLNQYNFSMLSIYHKDKISKNFILLLFTIYFVLNGVNFYVYLLILKISKTIYRCTYFSIHSISLIIALVISECIHYQMEHFFMFLCVLNLLCLLTFAFLSEFKELLYVINDLKIDIYRPSKNIQGKDKNQ